MTETGGKAGAMPLTAASPRDRRRHQRVEVALPGRYLLEDGSEHACECVDISAGGVRLRGAKAGPWGSRVIAYIEGVGRIEGYLVRRAPGWFAIETRASQRKEERVEERIAWIVDNHAQNAGRRSARRDYPEREHVKLATSDGRRLAAELADISPEGAALLVDTELESGARVKLNGRRAKVVRAFPGGLALAFDD